jgi:hypothetical protein
MKKRVLAAFLWFYAFWYVGAVVAYVLGISPLLGPIIGAAAAALFAGDPRGIIWRTRTSAPPPTTSQPGTYLIG